MPWHSFYMPFSEKKNSNDDDREFTDDATALFLLKYMPHQCFPIHKA
jgi:hypothetical protein